MPVPGGRPHEQCIRLDDWRPSAVSAFAIVVAAGAALAAQFLTRLIGLDSNVAFYGRIGMAFVSPDAVASFTSL